MRHEVLERSVRVIDHSRHQWEERRPGVTSRAWSGAIFGSAEITIVEQKMAPGTRSPLHWHYVEEQIVLLAGKADIMCDSETRTVGAGNTVIFPARAIHGFENVGEDELHIIGAWPWPFFELYFEHDPPGVVTRQYEALGDGQLRKLVGATE